jgi:hypothetical protein
VSMRGFFFFEKREILRRKTVRTAGPHKTL